MDTQERISRLAATDIAWLAGLFEGEGCIYFEKKGSVSITIKMTDRDIIERVHKMVPCKKISTVHPKPAQPHYKQPKPQYGWNHRHEDDVRPFLEAILPYLGERRGKKTREALSHYDTRPGTGGTHKARTHCPQGHEYVAENTYIHPVSGHRHCRKCKLAWAKRNRDPINARRRKPNGRGPYKKKSI